MQTNPRENPSAFCRNDSFGIHSLTPQPISGIAIASAMIAENIWYTGFLLSKR